MENVHLGTTLLTETNNHIDVNVYLFGLIFVSVGNLILITSYYYSLRNKHSILLIPSVINIVLSPH